jgi:tyrosyl-tRNA synthetase
MHDDRRQRRFADAGHDAVALADGATGMIGDPGGKSKEQGRRSFGTRHVPRLSENRVAPESVRNPHAGVMSP